MLINWDIPAKKVKAFCEKNGYRQALADGAIPPGTTDNRFMKDKLKDFIDLPYLEQKKTIVIQDAVRTVVDDEPITEN